MKPQKGNMVHFDMKSKYDDAKPILGVDIPINTMRFILLPQKTKELPFGVCVHDIQIIFSDRRVDTFINNGKLKLMEGVC